MELILELGNETILVVIEGKNVKFGSTDYGAALTDISGLKLSREGVIKEFPDLEDKDNWREEACKRFKKKIKGMETEEEISYYIIEELIKSGYKPMLKRRKGFRPEKL